MLPGEWSMCTIPFILKENNIKREYQSYREYENRMTDGEPALVRASS